jgi:hypothetical protein
MQLGVHLFSVGIIISKVGLDMVAGQTKVFQSIIAKAAEL